MGPDRTRDQKVVQDDYVKALLQDKDDRITALEARLEAYGARASTAHTRLLKTIDALDALRSQHALEISTEEQGKRKLLHDVDRLRSAVKDLEVEKDELKDVVEDLIQKVGCISPNMQRGNLNVDFPEQVAASAIQDTGRAKEDYNNDLLAYATSIIARLRTELDFERQSHSRTVEEANLHIEELEAKIAVREAELENRVTSPGGPERQPGGPSDVSTRASGEVTLGKRFAEPRPLSDEDCLRFLESNNARNRSLEIEIRHIVERLEQARTGATSSSGSRIEPLSPTLQNGHKATPKPSPRTRSASVDPNALSHPLNIDKVKPAPDPATPSAMPSIAQLDNQIRAMTIQMDALVSERTTLIEAAARQRRVTDGLNIDAFHDVLRVEGECVRLQAEADDLREQLQHARTHARMREKALLREIAHLRASSSGASASRSTPDLYRAFSSQPLEEDITTEESVELVSPLTPITFLGAPSYDAHTEGDLVSLSSPNHASSPVSTPCTVRRSPGPEEVEKVQVALDAARTHLAQKEEALAQLRAEMEKLQQEVRARTGNDSSDDGDGG